MWSSGNVHNVIRAALAALAAFALISYAAPHSARSDEKAPPSFQGTWKLDESKSESLQSKMSEMRQGGGPGGGPTGGGGGRGGPPPGGMGGGPPSGGGPGGRGNPGGSGEGDPGSSPMMKGIAQPPLLMSIDQTDTLIELSKEGNVFKRILLGERAAGEASSSQVVAQMSGRWKGQRLVAEITGARGGKVQETYELSKDGETLQVSIRFEMRSGMPFIELKRVYNLYEGE